MSGDFVLALRRPRRVLTAAEGGSMLADLNLGPSCTMDVEDPQGAPGFFPEAAQVTVGGYEAPSPLATVSAFLATLAAPLWSLLALLGLIQDPAAPPAQPASSNPSSRPTTSNRRALGTLPPTSSPSHPDSTNNGNSTLQQPRQDD